MPFFGPKISIRVFVPWFSMKLTGSRMVYAGLAWRH